MTMEKCHPKSNHPKNLPALLVMTFLLTACGGGGGGGGGTPPPADGGNNGSLQGRLWHDNYALDFLDGTQIAHLSGALPIHVTPRLTAWPWPDGNQYATAEADTDQTEVNVHALADGALLHSLTVEGYLRGIKPSPVSNSVILATWGEDSISTAYAVFYDLATETVLDGFGVDQASVDWLPDGRYLQVSLEGAIITGTVGGETTSSGSVTLPEQWEVRDVDVSPDGTKILITGVVPSIGGGINEADLWVANPDGSDLKRLTITGMSYYGQWSPDSAHIAFDVDTGLVCGAGSCAGKCELWYAPATAQNLDALSESDIQAQFRVVNRQGETRVLGCDLQGWTP